MNTIEELYRLLNDDGIDIDTIELAESLWLSQYISKTEIISSSDNDSNTEVNEKSIKKDINSSPTKNESPKNTTRVNQKKQDKRKDAPLHPIGDTNNKHSLPFRTPTVRKLYKDNDLIYAFRHFRQKIVSLKKVKLDEEKVADYMAQTDIFRPFYKKSYEKKFNILFIVDISKSMNIWEGLIEDFIKDVKSYHIFKKVLIYYVDTNEDVPKFFKKKEKLSELNSRWYSYAESNTLVFMFSDMISKSWSSGKLIEEIFLWEKYFPFAIVQMLPQRLWNGTKLIDASIGKMTSRKKFIGNTKLLSQMEERLRVEGGDISELVKIPLLAFNENGIDAYGRVMRSLPNNKIEGALFEKEDFQGEYEFSVSDNNLKAEDRLRAFYKYASSISKELLELLATVPLSLPIIKLVQQKLLPYSTQEHLSEIFMSSIFDKEQKVEGFYQFYKAHNEDSGVREELIKKIGAKKAFQTIVKISDVIQKQGGTFDFLAYVMDPEQLKNSKNFNEIDREFARISVSVLKEMGGEYRTLAQRLKNGYVFDEHKYGSDKKTVKKPSKSIRVIGVGGSGNNVIDHMIQEGISEIDLIAANSDVKALEDSFAPYKIQLGINATRGLGVGMAPDKGKEAALESFEDIKEMLDGSDMVFVVAGLGGGTGTGAAPIIAQLAKEMGALTISIVTSPFKFEGNKRTKLAKEGLEKLKIEGDSTIVIPNEKLLSLVEKNLGIKESFREVDGIITQTIVSISNVILSNEENDINLDFADIKTVMSYGGLSGVGRGYASGINSAYNAAKLALESPLFNDMSIPNVKGVLVHFNVHQDVSILEVSDAMNLIEESVGIDTPVIFGTTTSSNMNIDESQVTIIATGIEKISEIDITNRVIEQLKDQGWDDSNIKLEYKIENQYRADIVLIKDNTPSAIPIAIIEIKSKLNDINISKAIEQVSLYAKKLNVLFTYISDGKKIYEYDTEKKITKLVKSYPSSIDLEENILSRKYLTILPSSLSSSEVNYFIENRLDKTGFAYITHYNSFIVVNGAVGVGKTTFVLNYLDSNSNYDHIAYIQNKADFFRNLKEQLFESMDFNMEDTIDDVIEKLSLLNRRKILVLDDVDDTIIKYEDYLIKLAESGWRIILITSVENFNFKRIGDKFSIYYYTMHPYSYAELSTIFKNSIIGNGYPKTGKVLTVLDGLTDKKLLQVGNGLSNNFEILALTGLHEVFMHNGISSTKVLSYYEGRPNILDKIMNSEIDLIILQISSNMTKDELHNIFIIFQTAQQNDVPLIVDEQQLDKFMFDLALVYYECTECDRLDSFTCHELDWETVSGSERNMGPESEHQAIHKDICKKCNNKIEITLTCWEYPAGVEETRDIEAIGAKVIEGDCCPDLHNEYSEDSTKNDEFGGIENNYNLLVIDTNLMHLDIIRNTFEGKGFNPAKIFPRRTESENFINDIQVLSHNSNILELRDYIIQAIENFNIHALIIEPILVDEEINHPNNAIGSKVITELEKIDEYKKLPILVLSHLRKYAMVDNLIVSDNILLVKKPYMMNRVEMANVLDEDIIDDLNNNIRQYLEFKTETTSSTVLTLGSMQENLYDEIYQSLLEVVDDVFKDYSLDADYLPEGIDEVTITELSMPEELEFIKLIKNDDTYILNLKFETEAYVWMLIDKNHHDYISLKPLPVRDHNKQYYNAESEEILYIELSVEFKIDKNDKIRDLVIYSIDDVVLIEDEHFDEREQNIKDKISEEITSILKTEHLKGLDYFQIHDESLPGVDNSATISSYDLPEKIEIEDIEIYSNQFESKVYLEQEVYLDINILKNEYYSNAEYVSLYGAVEELNKHYLTVEGKALISIELNIQSTRDKDIDSMDALNIEIIGISVVKQIPIGNNNDFDSSGIHRTPKEFDKSFDTFYESLGVNSKDANYFYDLGQTYFKMKSYDRAIEVYLKAIRIDPNNDAYYESLGKVYSDIGNYKEAVKTYLKAIDINPTIDTYYTNLGETYNQMGEFSKAKEIFQKSIDIKTKRI